MAKTGSPTDPRLQKLLDSVQENEETIKKLHDQLKKKTDRIMDDLEKQVDGLKLLSDEVGKLVSDQQSVLSRHTKWISEMEKKKKQ